MWYKIERDGYILAISRTFGTKITKEEYDQIERIVMNVPEAVSGYGYKLTSNLEWELVTIPTGQDEPTIEDYEDALEELGVK